MLLVMVMQAATVLAATDLDSRTHSKSAGWPTDGPIGLLRQGRNPATNAEHNHQTFLSSFLRSQSSSEDIRPSTCLLLSYKPAELARRRNKTGKSYTGALLTTMKEKRTHPP